MRACIYTFYGIQTYMYILYYTLAVLMLCTYLIHSRRCKSRDVDSARLQQLFYLSKGCAAWAAAIQQPQRHPQDDLITSL